MTGYPSIDKPWLKYYSEEAINAPLPECTLYEYLWENNKDHLEDFCIGGDYIAPSREAEAKRWLTENGNQYGLFKGYGMCECGGTVTASNGKCNTVGAAGIPTPHVKAASFDIHTGKELPYGKMGELRICTPSHMLCYFKNPEETEKFFHTDENGDVWACTGDMGYVDEDGSIFVSGRIADSYSNNAGEPIYLFDIERAVLDIPEVRQSKAVVSEIDGKKTHVCHLVLKQNTVQADVLNAISNHCIEKLPENHVPYFFRFYEDTLPIGPSGKLDVIKMQSSVDEIIDIRRKLKGALHNG